MGRREEKIGRLYGWLSPQCEWYEVDHSHVEILYDKNARIPRLTDRVDPGIDYLIQGHNWVKLNDEIYGITYNELTITLDQIMWLEEHKDLMTDVQKIALYNLKKECVKIEYECY